MRYHLRSGFSAWTPDLITSDFNYWLLHPQDSLTFSKVHCEYFNDLLVSVSKIVFIHCCNFDEDLIIFKDTVGADTEDSLNVSCQSTLGHASAQQQTDLH